jgi:hypothetical protein
VWSPNSNEIVFTGLFENVAALYRKNLLDGTIQQIQKHEVFGYPTDWSHDGTTVVYTAAGRNYDIRTLKVDDGNAQEFLGGQGTQTSGQISPDGKWLAYMASSGTGRIDVYVRPLLSSGRETLISVNGGQNPRWRGDSKEIFFENCAELSGRVGCDSGQLYSVQVRRADADRFEVAEPQPLFATPLVRTFVLYGWVYRYDVSADGQRFLVVTRAEEQEPHPMSLVVNWTALLNSQDRQ